MEGTVSDAIFDGGSIMCCDAHVDLAQAQPLKILGKTPSVVPLS